MEIIEVPSSLKVSILGQIKGNSTLYLWKLTPKYEQVYIDSWVTSMISYWELGCLEYQGRQP